MFQSISAVLGLARRVAERAKSEASAAGTSKKKASVVFLCFKVV